MLNLNESFIFNKEFNLDNKTKYSNDDIKSIFKEAKNYIQKNKKRQVEKFHEFKLFLGQKRSNNKSSFFLENEDIKSQTDYFPNQAKIKQIKVTKDLLKNLTLIIEGTDGEYHDKLMIYDKPIIIIKIYDYQRVDISIISDSKAFEKEYKVLNQYDYEMLSLNNESKIINIKKFFEDQNLIKSIDIENENFLPYIVSLKSLIPKIKESDLLYDNIYIKEIESDDKDLLAPNEISTIFFYYFNIESNLQNTYKFINSNNRKKLLLIIYEFLNTFQNNNILIIMGPKGIGKTTSLINISFNSIYNIFYFNIEIFKRYKTDPNQIKELEIQVLKLFHDIFDETLLKAKDEIWKFINCKYDINCIEYIYKVIKIFYDYIKLLDTNFGNFCFIIDQYSFKEDKNSEYNIYKIISLVQSANYIKVIICPTINNNFSKNEFNNLLEKRLNDSKINIHYFQEFINKEDMIEIVLKNENDKYLEFMEEVGFLPKLFYDSKVFNIKLYKKNILLNLKENINEYVKNKNTIENDKMLLDLLDLIIGEKLICSSELKEKIYTLPLKYLKLIKYNIKKDHLKELSQKLNPNNNKNEDILLQYFKFLFNFKENKELDPIINQYFHIEEKNIEDYIDNYIERDNSSKNIYGTYYESFIGENTKVFSYDIELEEIILFKLELSMNLFKDVIYEQLYKDIKKEYNFFKNILDKGSNGGFFELLVDFYIQSKKTFIVENIEKVYYISSIVPNKYSINYYSSKRKIDKFEEFELKKNNNKKKIPFKNVYIKQTIFNSKYYDMALLIKTCDGPNQNNFHLVSIQATISKDPEKRMMKEEHELILGATKQNIENEFDIVIDDAYFVYVLSEKNNKIEDENTQKDCDNNGIKYIGFNIESIQDERKNKQDKYKIDLKSAFITNSFPIHNSASLLYFNKDKNIEYILLKDLINEKLKDSKEIEERHFNIIKNNFENKYNLDTIYKSQFKYFTFNMNYNIENINKYLTEFCFLLFKDKKNKNIDSINFISAFGKFYELPNWKVYEKFKIKKNALVELIYSKKPLKLKEN